MKVINGHMLSVWDVEIGQVQMDFDTGMDSWYRELFGEDWVKKNTFQRRELERQAKENGENTPM